MSAEPRRSAASAERFARRWGVWIRALGVAAALGSGALVPAAAHAQRRFALTVESGSGLEIAGSGGQALLRHTPTYLELGVVSWLAHDDGVWLGGGLRAEVEERASIGGAMRTGLFLRLAPIEVRPAIGVVAILAPYTLVGPEVGITFSLSLADEVALATRIVVDGFLAGSDLVPGSVLVMVNGTFGVEIHL